MTTLVDRAIGNRLAPLACAIVAAICVLLTWGAGPAWPLMHDEWAYWTQASQYAANHWAYPPPPAPEFFEQLYVFVTPMFAAKYWPGHAMAIAPGFLLGIPALMPIVLSAIAGGLVFALARRVAGARVAALTFVLWVGTFGNLRFRASYFSELTTSCAWLVAWWALLRWRETRRWSWMALLAVATGWGAISRPATMFVFAIPVGLLVISDTVRGRHWRDLAIGLVCGTAVLGLLPLWNAKTTGDARVTPLGVYTKEYLPFDVPGYSVDSLSPTRPLPPEMERVRAFLREIKVEQATSPAWRTFAERTGFLLRDAFAGWRLPFVFAFAIGLVVGGPVGWFVFASTLLLVAAYVTQAHTRDWTIYYLEVFPAVAFIAALGARRIVRDARLRVKGGAQQSRIVMGAVALAALALVARDTMQARQIYDRLAAHTRDFRAGVAALPEKPNVVFVRYAEGRNMHLSLVANDGNLDRAPSWIVHDLGARNARLISAAPNRAAYLYDEASNSFARMTP